MDPSGCWIWLRYISSNGYPRLGGQWAHRLAWQERHGPIPAGAQLDHLCRVRRCVNPDHLEPVSAAENGLRSPLRTRLSTDDVLAIRGSSESSYTLAARYGINPSWAWRIREGHARANCGYDPRPL